MAWQRARASEGRTTWFQELYGWREPFVTSKISRITLELMIEQGRQEQLAMAKAQKKFVDVDFDLKMDPDFGYSYLRPGMMRVRF